MRAIVAGVGNVLRGDDGFGAAVARRLASRPLPGGTDVIETGIGGIALLQEILAGCDALIVLDAIDRGAPPGTVFVLAPELDAAEHVADVHLVNPQRVLEMAKAMGALPPRVRIVGCQPATTDELEATLSPAVEAAVEVAVARVDEILAGWEEGPLADARA